MSDKPVLSSASLLDLKAELLRKQESVKQTKLQRNVYEGVILSKLKRSEDDKKVPKALPEKAAVLPATAEEENALRNSRTMLERKALLYDKLSKGLIIPDEEQSERFLVNFQKKPPTVDVQLSDFSVNSRPVESIPSLPIANNVKKVSEAMPPLGASPDEIVPESADNLKTGPTHYQNIQHKEVRNHGVGYFSFSMEEDERKKQMDVLNALRQQTVGQREASEKQKRKRNSQLKARLAKVRQRKNIAPLENDAEDSLEDSEKSSEDETSVETKHEENSEDIVEPPKPVHVRPWDKGKDFPDLLPERKVYKRPGDTWKESRRTERLPDFAPPSSYNKESQKTRSWLPKISKANCTENVDDFCPQNVYGVTNFPHPENGGEFCPPNIYDTSNVSQPIETCREKGKTSCHQSDQAEEKCNPEDEIAQKLAFFRQQFN